MNTTDITVLEDLEIVELDNRIQYNAWTCEIAGAECSSYVLAAAGIIAVGNPLIGAIVAGVGGIMAAAGC